VLLKVFIIALIAAVGLPEGFEKAKWGMTADELQAVAPVEKMDAGEGFNYAEHLEEDPEVYARMTEAHERIEYYFFEGRLYKIFIIYDRTLFHTPFYDRLIEEVKRQYGPPQDSYTEPFFDLTIQHTLWEDEASTLDLRKGAGFIYQVRIHKAAAEKKERSAHKKKGI
jgi:hypothetical protein